VIHFRRLQQGGDGCLGPATALATREQHIFSRYCLGSDGAFDNIGIDFDTAVEQKAPEDLPSGGGVADRLGQFCKNPRQFCFERKTATGLSRRRSAPRYAGIPTHPRQVWISPYG
jgi:hypothetical protein